jgi:hypothetical protein
MADTAKIYSSQRTVPIYLGEGDGFRLPGKAKWRLADATAYIVGAIITGTIVTANITAAHPRAALYTLIIGAVLTFVAVVVLGRLPVTRPAPIVRALWMASNLWPRVRDSGKP